MACSTVTKVYASIAAIVLVLYYVVIIPLFIVFGDRGLEKPNISIESTTVKAYNLTSDNHLFCIINIGVKAHNPYRKKTTLDLYGINMEVRKGKHHKLADDILPSFRVGSGGDAVVGVEAVGLRVGLEKKIAREIRDGEGRVNLYMTGFVGPNFLGVTCKNVVVDFSRLVARVDQKVNCEVSVTSPDDGD